MSLHAIREMCQRMAALRLAIARIDAVPSLLDDPHLTFSALAALCMGLLIDAPQNAAVLVGEGYTCEGVTEKLRTCLESVGARLAHAAAVEKQQRTLRGDEDKKDTPSLVNAVEHVRLSQLDQQQLIQLLPTVVAACNATRVRMLNVLSALTTSLKKLLQSAGMGNAPSLTEVISNAWLSVADSKNGASSALLFVNGLSMLSYRGGGGLSSLDTFFSQHTRTLAFVSLCNCALSDDGLKAIATPLSRLVALRALDLSENALTDKSFALLVSMLSSVGARQAGGGEAFPMLERLNVTGNMLVDPAGKQQRLSDLLCERFKASARMNDVGIVKEQQQQHRVLVLDGVGMGAICIAKFFSSMDSSEHVGGVEAPTGAQWLVSESVTMIAASSFSSIIAAALVAGLPMAKVHAFFARVAATVFADHDYSSTYGYRAIPGDSILSATRWVRRWYSGGNYYNWDAFMAAVEELFGSALLSMTLEAFGASFPSMPRLLLIARNANHGALRAFRTNVDTGALAGEEGKGAASCVEEAAPPGQVTLREALAACCAIPGYFAPFSVLLSSSSASSTTPTTACGGIPMEDCMLSPLELALCEAAPKALHLSNITIRVVASERPAPAPQPETPPTLHASVEASTLANFSPSNPFARVTFDGEALVHTLLTTLRSRRDAHAALQQSSIASTFGGLQVEHLPNSFVLPEARARDALWQRLTAESMLRNDCPSARSSVGSSGTQEQGAKNDAITICSSLTRLTSPFKVIPTIHPSSVTSILDTNAHAAEVLGSVVVQDMRVSFRQGLFV